MSMKCEHCDGEGWVGAGPFPPLTRLDCTPCGGTGQKKWWDAVKPDADP